MGGGEGPLENWEIPALIDLAVVRREIAVNGPAMYPYVVLQCNHHPECKKRRGLGASQCKVLGRREPLAFVHAWHRLGPDYADASSHINACKPTMAQIRASFAVMDDP